MRDLAELLRGLAALLWPLVAVVALWLFRDPLRDLIRRIRRARFAGGEIELDRRLAELQLTTEVLEATPLPAKVEQADMALVDEAQEDMAAEILRTAASSPRAGLMLASSEIEREMRRVLAAVGHYPERPTGIGAMARELVRVAGLPEAYAKAYEGFSDIRNAIVHGRGDVSDVEVLRALDVGLSLLRLTHRWPHERRTVLYTDLDVYFDAEGTRRRPDVTAVVLMFERPDRSEPELRAYPTTRDHFHPGQPVAWEWDMSRTWGESWYRDSSGTVRYGWRESAEFVGRPLDDP
jgi:hypothetical protein